MHIISLASDITEAWLAELTCMEAEVVITSAWNNLSPPSCSSISYLLIIN